MTECHRTQTIPAPAYFCSSERVLGQPHIQRQGQQKSAMMQSKAAPRTSPTTWIGHGRTTKNKAPVSRVAAALNIRDVTRTALASVYLAGAADDIRDKASHPELMHLVDSAQAAQRVISLCISTLCPSNTTSSAAVLLQEPDRAPIGLNTSKRGTIQVYLQRMSWTSPTWLHIHG